ncbi:MAG TPA: hypothetical protein VEK07_17820 [Polyangiaceae bacterium]|nr:hypothetical protein [Polyangiaceae bacterium]
MKRIVQASVVLIAPLVSFACDRGANRADRLGELAQADPGAANPQPGTGLYDAGLLPTPGTSPRPTDPSIGPSESPTMPTNPGTDPAQGYPSTPDDNSGGAPGGGQTP